MANVQSGTRMMVNRYIELLRARLQCAPTRHIANRHQRLSSTRCQHLEQSLKDREKADAYNKNKRLSMWEQNGGRFSDADDHKRMDTNQYRPKDLDQRRYNCTWTDFPESAVVNENNSYTLPTVEEAPKRRRSSEDRPNTAMPYDDEAISFLSQWDSNSAMINRNKYVLPTDSCPPPVVNNDLDYALVDRKRKFHF
ncbi:uncharacterized protein LOC110186201 [Drosophila serrata]|uniref:uncharacterized protein LOC110186201 n=1 Tax=Drosophila serrata TaxID=7274 RepID=UPI000A1D1A31|nr:uncharacterized protein LOC110186201 [Drosophila serrata]